MGQKITARTNQSIADIALQEAGTFEAAFELAKNNGLSITSSLTPGMELEVGGLPTNIDILDYYKRNVLSPATIQGKLLYVGIGYMQIENDFKVG